MTEPSITHDPQDYLRVQQSEEFGTLRRRFRSFAFPVTVLFLVWYLLYVLLSTYAVEFMSIRLFGNVNVALLLGLLQFVSTFLITGLYVRHANRSIDPIATQLREGLEVAPDDPRADPALAETTGATEESVDDERGE